MTCENIEQIIPVQPVNVVVGHYGVGKTNFALNWALNLARADVHVILVDFDVVNPYFRSSDYTELLESAGVRVIAPVLAGSSLDTPSISGAVTVAIETAYAQAGQSDAPIVIIDAGGDDVGATVLGRFSESISAGAYQMLYVVNKYRNLTQDVESALEVMAEIQIKSHLSVTGVVNNSHLRDVTEVATITQAYPFGVTCAQVAGVPLVCTTAPNSFLEQKNAALEVCGETAKFYPVRMLVRTPWE